MASPRDRDLEPASLCVWEADLQGLFFESSPSVADAAGSFWTSRSSEDTECSLCVGWSSGRGGGKETAGEAQHQREVDLGSASHGLNANMQKRRWVLASGREKNGRIRVLDLSRSPQEMAEPCSHPWVSALHKACSEAEGKGRAPLPAQQERNQGQPCTSADWEGQESTKNERQLLGKLAMWMKGSKALKGCKGA